MIVKKDFSLKDRNTFNLDVKAKYFTEVISVAELQELLNNPQFKTEKKLMLGGGSNILFTEDFDGLVIQYQKKEISIIEEGEATVKIKADAGREWHELVMFAVKAGYGGIENLSLIPGKVGAAPIQNIGAYGQELKDSFVSLSGLFCDNGVIKEFTKEECRFGYRNSIFKQELKGKFIITDIVLELNKNPKINIEYGDIKRELLKREISNPGIKDVSDVIIDIRRSKIPDTALLGNAGSFFKNPELDFDIFENIKTFYPEVPHFFTDNKVKVPAAWLIEKSGMKGIRIGNAGTYNKQPLVIVNYGGASADEIFQVKEYVKGEVKSKFNISLEEEVNII
jgi:UDP-N-acetylmuramate dehydrogenase